MSDNALPATQTPETAPFSRTPRLLRAVVPALPFLWLLIFFLTPFAIVFRMSLSQPATAQPPYTPVIDWAQGLAGLWAALGELNIDNFLLLADDYLYVASAFSSLRMAAVSTLLLLLIGFPMAYAMAKAPENRRPVLLVLVILPFWTSFLIRVYAWIGILKPEGLLNTVLISLGLIDQPLQIVNTDIAIFIGVVYCYLPFMVLPLYATLEKMDWTLIEAAQDLGCPPWRAFWRITVPLALPGIAAGALLCFIPIVGEYVIPELLGGPDSLMIGKTLSDEFFKNRDWPLASAVAVVLLIIVVGPVMVYRELETRRLEKAR
ncbi:putrescine transport system permease protein [Pseudochelatococcus lubricantis]|uniref:Putrescine transport system permease protein n=1 Tax=Pseudochelatococcus lubricantis TaxID=1538102 RepID=A0ABX0V313_9HYPH|nr:ABC transporter permease subunit [Pseudochelatococcus lubricantis]NIJ59606.1 putrescine transport system permease protein [Pseudochelatococcus lubricantis]